MDVLNIFDVTLSPVSMAWVTSIVGASLSIYFNILSPGKFTFATARIKQEPWRLILAFCYLGPLLIGLIQNCYFVVKTVGMLEEVYMFSYGIIPLAWTQHLNEDLRNKAMEIIARNRTRDFAYFIVQLGISIALAVWTASAFVAGPKVYLLGPPLQRVMLYIRCRIYPEQQINIMGLGVKAKYAFIASQFLEFLISDEYFTILSIFSKSPSLALKQFLSSPLLYEAALEFCVGHFWWYLRYFYLDMIYNECQDEWSRTYLRKSTYKFDFQELLRFLITPVWYKLITDELLEEQRIAHGEFFRPLNNPLRPALVLFDLDLAENDTTEPQESSGVHEVQEAEEISGINELPLDESELDIESIPRVEGATGMARRESA